MMQDTPPRKRVSPKASETRPCLGNVVQDPVPQISQAASSSIQALAPRIASHCQATSHFVFWFPKNLPSVFVESCKEARKKKAEHLAFLLGHFMPGASSPQQTHVCVTHMIFPKQLVRAQTVDADLESLQELLAKEGLFLFCRLTTVTEGNGGGCVERDVTWHQDNITKSTIQY